MFLLGSDANRQVIDEPQQAVPAGELELGSKLAPEVKEKSNSTGTNHHGKGELIIDPEFFRFLGYLSFWFMIIVSVIVTSATVDVPDPNPLELTFGYTNICLYFDYDPPRIVAAMIYPMVEYSMVLYVLTNWYIARTTFQRHGKTIYTIFTVATCVEVVLIAWFRLVFVVRAFEDVVGHTIPFMGLQITLSMIAVQNTVYYNLLHDDEVNWKRLSCTGSLQSYLSIFGWIYTILLFVVTMVKIILTSGVLNGHPLMEIGTPAQEAVGSFFDWTWMFLAAVTPFLISIYLMCEDKRPKIITNLTMNLYQPVSQQNEGS